VRSWAAVCALPRMLANRLPLVASPLLGILWAGLHAPLFCNRAVCKCWLHILFIVTTTVRYTLMHNGSGGSVLLAMAFHTGWNLIPGVIPYPSSTGAELQQAFTLFLVGGIAVSMVTPAHLIRGCRRRHPAALRR
jgi:membrane protease YdiL (CAAX protease family)